MRVPVLIENAFYFPALRSLMSAACASRVSVPWVSVSVTRIFICVGQIIVPFRVSALFEREVVLCLFVFAAIVLSVLGRASRVLRNEAFDFNS